MNARRYPIGLVAVLGLTAVVAADAAACPFCSVQGQTLSGEVQQADFIVLGILTNSQRDPNDFTRGTTDLIIETVVKPHSYLVGKKMLRIPRPIPVGPKAEDNKYLVFCSLYTRPVDSTAAAVVGSVSLANFEAAQLDAYRGEQVKEDSKLAEYLKGAIEVKQQDPISRLRYFFNYLDHPDLVISTDAMNEFASADYKEVRELSKNLPADKVLKWLKDPNTPASRFGLYGLFIAHCGKKEHARNVRELLDDPDRAFSSGLDGILTAYIMLDPTAGWDYLMAKLRDPKQEFPVRYAGLKVLRFFWEFRPDVVAHDKVLDGMRLLVAQSDMADLPIEDLRKWGQWGETPYIMKFTGEASHKSIPIVRRAILRFALAAPDRYQQAKAYVEKTRQEDPERVKFVEQTLKDEQPRPPATTRAGSGSPPGPGGN
jgi:hypothetical protein